MHRKHIRATVNGADIDIPISTFVDGQWLQFVGGSIVTAPLVLPGGDVIGPASSTDTAIVRWDGVTGTAIQNSVVLVSDLGQVTGVTALNGRDIARWTDGPAIGGATDDAVARWDSTTGRLLQNSVVTINDAGDITTPGNLNPTSIGSIPVGVLVRSSLPTTHVDNSVARWDGTTGNSLDDSLVVIDDLGNVTGVTTLNTRDPARWVDGPTPAVSVHGNITVWDGTSGRLIADSGLNVANVVYNLDSEVVSGHLPEFTDSAGRRITDSGIISDHVVTSAAVGVDNRIARYDGAARAIQGSPITIDDSGNLTGVGTINGGGLSNLVRSSTSSVSDFEIVLWFGTDGRFITGSGILWNQVPYIASTFGPDNRIVRTDTATNNRAVQSSGITIDDSNNITSVANINGSVASRLVAYTVAASLPLPNEIACFDVNVLPMTVSYRPVAIDPSGNVTGVTSINGIAPANIVTAASTFATDNRVLRSDGTGRGSQSSAIALDDSNNISGVGTLNTRTIANWVDGPASATDNAVVRFDATTGKLVQNSVVIVDDSGNITGSNLAVGIASSTDNRVVRFDGAGGKQLQQSAVAIDDSGNITGAGTYNTINLVTHGLRHCPGGADPIASSLLAAGDILQYGGSGAVFAPKQFRTFTTTSGTASTSYLTVVPNAFFSSRAGTNVQVLIVIPYAISDTGSDIQVLVQWGNCSGRAVVMCGAQAGHITSSGGTGTLDTGSANAVPAVGAITIQFTAQSVLVNAFIAVGIRSTGSSHTIYAGTFHAIEDNP